MARKRRHGLISTLTFTSSDHRRATLPLEIVNVEVPVHSSCPDCHHFINKSILRLPAGGSASFRCHRCDKRLFGLGRDSTHASYASQQSTDLSQGNNPPRWDFTSSLLSTSCLVQTPSASRPTTPGGLPVGCPPLRPQPGENESQNNATSDSAALPGRSTSKPSSVSTNTIVPSKRPNKVRQALSIRFYRVSSWLERKEFSPFKGFSVTISLQRRRQMNQMDSASTRQRRESFRPVPPGSKSCDKGFFGHMRQEIEYESNHEQPKIKSPRVTSKPQELGVDEFSASTPKQVVWDQRIPGIDGYSNSGCIEPLGPSSEKEALEQKRARLTIEAKRGACSCGSRCTCRPSTFEKRSLAARVVDKVWGHRPDSTLANVSGQSTPLSESSGPTIFGRPPVEVLLRHIGAGSGRAQRKKDSAMSNSTLASAPSSSSNPLSFDNQGHNRQDRSPPWNGLSLANPAASALALDADLSLEPGSTRQPPQRESRNSAVVAEDERLDQSNHRP